LREIPLGGISTELFSPRDIAVSAERDHPLVVIEEAGRFLLVDGFRRFFALRAEGKTSAWALVKTWSRTQAKLERLRLNNPQRCTSLREELLILDDLHQKDGLSLHALCRGLGRRRSWVKRRLEIIDRLSPDAASALPESLFHLGVAEGLAALPTEEQTASALSIALAKLHAPEASRFLRLLQVRGEEERAALRENPRKSLEGLRSPAPLTPLESLVRLPRLLDRALAEVSREDHRQARPILLALIRRAQVALISLGGSTETAAERTQAVEEFVPLPTNPPKGGPDHDPTGDRRTRQEAPSSWPGHPLDRSPPGALPCHRAGDPEGQAAAHGGGDDGDEAAQSPRSLQGSGGVSPFGWLLRLPCPPKDPQGGIHRGPHDPRRLRAHSEGPSPAASGLRFETLPGEEAQQDWSPYRVSIDGKPAVIQLFSLILAWSRYQFLRAYRDQRFNSLLYGHVAAFRHFSGVPWRLVYDNQATITPFRIGGKPILNDQFSEFSRHYGFEVFVCLPGDKERKGKIERPFDYFEKAFLPTRIFHSLEDLNRQIERWLSGLDGPGEGNHREHGTTREVPYQRWLEEKEYLYPLPRTDHLPREVEERIVGPDLTISVLGNLYTVPPSVKGKKVWVSIGEGDLLVYDPKGEEVARHRLAEKKGGVVIDQAHYAALKRARKPIPLPQMEREFLGRFPNGGAFLAALKRTVSSIAPIHLREILGLARRWRVEEVEGAMARSLSDGTPTAGYVREVLRRIHPTGHLSDLETEVPRGLSLGPIDCGEASGYDGIFEPEGKE
jgi:ParB-like chromosome segregation protein Spo0J